MRQVNRDSVGAPPRLMGDLSAEIEKIKQGQKAQPTIYRHPDVVSKLRCLYLDKCFLCECHVGEGGEVEHFLPWHKGAPERAYDWKNLNWSCPHCNKSKKQFHSCEFSLIDPSNPPCCLDELISFDKDCNMHGGRNTEYVQKPEVQHTLELLNNPFPRSARRVRLKELEESIFEIHKTSWEKLQKMDSIEPATWSNEERSQLLPALDRADALYNFFLTEKAPFSVCMQAVLFPLFHFTVHDFRRMSEAYRSLINAAISASNTTSITSTSTETQTSGLPIARPM